MVNHQKVTDSKKCTHPTTENSLAASADASAVVLNTIPGIASPHLYPDIFLTCSSSSFDGSGNEFSAVAAPLEVKQPNLKDNGSILREDIEGIGHSSHKISVDSIGNLSNSSSLIHEFQYSCFSSVGGHDRSDVSGQQEFALGQDGADGAILSEAGTAGSCSIAAGISIQSQPILTQQGTFSVPSAKSRRTVVGRSVFPSSSRSYASTSASSASSSVHSRPVSPSSFSAASNRTHSTEQSTEWKARLDSSLSSSRSSSSCGSSRNGDNPSICSTDRFATNVIGVTGLKRGSRYRPLDRGHNRGRNRCNSSHSRSRSVETYTAKARSNTTAPSSPHNSTDGRRSSTDICGYFKQRNAMASRPRSQCGSGRDWGRTRDWDNSGGARKRQRTDKVRSYSFGRDESYRGWSRYRSSDSRGGRSTSRSSASPRGEDRSEFGCHLKAQQAPTTARDGLTSTNPLHRERGGGGDVSGGKFEFEWLPLEWWEREEGCRAAKSKHMDRVDRLCDRETLVLNTTLSEHDTVLEPNMFPYATPKGVEHFTLWSIHDLSHQQIVQFVNSWLTAHMPQVRRWQYDDNSGERSIELFHVHVFIETLPYSFKPRLGSEYHPPHSLKV